MTTHGDVSRALASVQGTHEALILTASGASQDSPRLHF